MEMEGPYHNIIKSIYDILTVNVMLSGEKWKTFPLSSSTRQGYPVSSIQQSTGFLTKVAGQEKDKKRDPKRQRNETITI